MSAGLDSLDPTLLAAPMAAGLLVLATHVPLGIEVLRRGIIFIDLAIAQVAALGVIAAGLLHLDDVFGGAGTQMAAALAALLGAALLSWTERRWPEVQEALIGLLFVLAAALGILLLAGNPHGGEHLRDLLAGQILWVGWAGLLPVAMLYALVMGAWLVLRRKSLGGRFGFYALFACAVTASVQLVGVLLVFASLIAPAVATRVLSGRRRLVVAYLLGVGAYAAGLGLSLYADLPAGAMVVCCLGLMAFGGLARIKA
ncbi:MAG: metal ABC transporter permease [Rhodocyclales bacterium]|nr:metal ABC transporter permease [Rhodocyclales bacterium]